MRAVDFTNTYKKQYKRLKRAGWDMAQLDHTITVLATEDSAELECLWDHALEGRFDGTRKIHVGQKASNWVVQYQIESDGTLLLLLQTGSHNTVLRL